MFHGSDAFWLSVAKDRMVRERMAIEGLCRYLQDSQKIALLSKVRFYQNCVLSGFLRDMGQ